MSPCSDRRGPGADPSTLDPYCLAQLKHYRSLMPLSYEAHKPVFALKPADGAFGGHQAAVVAARNDFTLLADKIWRSVGGPADTGTPGVA